MHHPLVIASIALIAAIIVGVWSQRALPEYADSRPILFLLCLLIGTGSALCLLLDGLALLFTGQVATGGVRIYGPMLLLVVLWKPLNGLFGIIEDFVQRRAKKGRTKASATVDDADPLPPETRITFSWLPSAPGGRSDDIARTGAGQ
ncbi:hypothetical protein NUKP71_34750 [Klebsiella quasipneumoniae]|nr:hypothetical protein NUKP71_34750 [Klebsiella quasipneumoniae]